MLRKITLTTTNIATQLIAANAITRVVDKVTPKLFKSLDTEIDNKNVSELVTRGLTILGVSVGIALAANLVATAVTQTVDNVIFPNLEGPY